MTQLPSLTPDCRACTGLCCVATAFRRSADFAIDKAYGVPCPNLLADFACGIHDQLRDRGFAGCVAFDCLGAGQHTTAAFGGRTWRTDPDLAGQIFDVFYYLRELHTMLWCLECALGLRLPAALRAELRSVRDRIARVTDLPPDELTGSVVDACAPLVEEPLRRAGALARAGHGPGRDLRRADLAGADLSGTDLRAAELTGATLLGARLDGADLRWADLRGADLRDADLRGADLRDALFLHPSQLERTHGDDATRLPAGCASPAHWS